MCESAAYGEEGEKCVWEGAWPEREFGGGGGYTQLNCRSGSQSSSGTAKEKTGSEFLPLSLPQFARMNPAPTPRIPWGPLPSPGGTKDNPPEGLGWQRLALSECLGASHPLLPGPCAVGVGDPQGSLWLTLLACLPDPLEGAADLSGLLQGERQEGGQWELLGASRSFAVG